MAELNDVLLAHLFSQRRGFTNSRIGVYHGIPPRSGFEEHRARVRGGVRPFGHHAGGRPSSYVDEGAAEVSA